MKKKTRQEPLRFPLSLLHYGNSYYIDRIAELEQVLAKKPRQLQLDMAGEGEISPEWALLIRSILLQRSPKTRLITNARTYLKNGSLLVWLLGECRMIRDDAKIFFRRPTGPDEVADAAAVWKGAKCAEPDQELDEASYVKVLQLINEYLPVSELAGNIIDVSVLRQFGLVENEKLDRFLDAAFGQASKSKVGRANASAEKRATDKSKLPASGPAQK